MPASRLLFLLPPRHRHLPPGWQTTFWWTWVLAFLGSGMLVVLVTLPPFVGTDLRAMLMQGFSTVCHQIPSRSPQLHGVPLAVCHRCYGIYLGLPFAIVGMLVLYRWDAFFYRRAPWLLSGALLPLGLDWSGDVLGLWTNTPHSRMVTGLLFGMVAGYYVGRGMIEVALQRYAVRRPGLTQKKLTAGVPPGGLCDVSE